MTWQNDVFGNTSAVPVPVLTIRPQKPEKPVEYARVDVFIVMSMGSTFLVVHADTGKSGILTLPDPSWYMLAAGFMRTSLRFRAQESWISWYD